MAQYHILSTRIGTHSDELQLKSVHCVLSESRRRAVARSGGSKLLIGAGTLLDVVGKATIHLLYQTV